MKNLRIQGSSDILGLNDKEVQERVEKGQVNILPKTPSRTISQIIKANVFTLFNGLNLILAVIVCIAGSPKNALFSMVILTNTIIGIFQEVRSKITLEKLSVLNSMGAIVMRNGYKVKVNIEEIVKSLKDIETEIQVEAERGFLDGINGSCHIPIGAYCNVDGENIVLTGLYGDEYGKKLITRTIEGKAYQARELGLELAGLILKEYEVYEG